MREKLTQHKCISFTDKWADKIQDAADTFYRKQSIFWKFINESVQVGAAA